MGRTYAFPLSDFRNSFHRFDSSSQRGCHFAVSDSIRASSALRPPPVAPLAHREAVRGCTTGLGRARRQPSRCRTRPRITWMYAHVDTDDSS
jgi:hypothetical protein